MVGCLAHVVHRGSDPAGQVPLLICSPLTPTPGASADPSLTLWSSPLLPLLQLFKGKFYHCLGVDTRNITNRSDCVAANYRWVHHKYNFDNLGQVSATCVPPALTRPPQWVGVPALQCQRPWDHRSGSGPAQPGPTLCLLLSRPQFSLLQNGWGVELTSQVA